MTKKNICLQKVNNSCRTTKRQLQTPERVLFQVSMKGGFVHLLIPTWSLRITWLIVFILFVYTLGVPPDSVIQCILQLERLVQVLFQPAVR